MRRLIAPTLLVAALGTPALAADPVKVGMITTLSGPGGYLGEDMRDGFRLGATGAAVPIELLVEDDALKPGTA
ncbi:ABC transporter substrate-binding protein, partial [Acinetobacter baumannii]